MLLDKFIKPIQGITEKMVGDAEYELHG